MATFWPTNRLSSVDLPALGRPTSATNPAFMPSSPAPATGSGSASDTHFVDAAPLGLEDFDVQPVEGESLAHGRHAAHARQHVAADGLEFAVFDLHAEPLDQLADRDLRR